MSLQLEVEKQLGIPVKVKAGMPGAFDVYADGERIFSKAQTGRMPQNPEIVSAIAQRRRA